MREKLIDVFCAALGEEPDYQNEEANKFVDELIENGVTVQEWISVKDRLPENREDVLVVAFWHERWNVQWGWYAPNGKVWHIGLMEETDYPVSHWMPLPEPPKGE